MEGYSAALSISVSAKSREEIANVEAACSGLLKSGVPIFPEEARYYYTGLESLKMRLLEAAAQNARERAEKLVSGSGSKLGAVVSASQGIFQITRPLSNETSDWGMYDTSSFEKDVKCVVTNRVFRGGRAARLKRHYQLAAEDEGVVDVAVSAGPEYVLEVGLYGDVFVELDYIGGLHDHFVGGGIRRRPFPIPVI